MSEGICLWNGMASELFYGSEETVVPYAQAIENLPQALPGIDVYNNHSEFGLPQRIREQMGCGSQLQNIARLVDIYGTMDPDHIDLYGPGFSYTAALSYAEKICFCAGKMRNTGRSLIFKGKEKNDKDKKKK